MQSVSKEVIERVLQPVSTSVSGATSFLEDYMHSTVAKPWCALLAMLKDGRVVDHLLAAIETTGLDKQPVVRVLTHCARVYVQMQVGLLKTPPTAPESTAFDTAEFSSAQRTLLDSIVFNVLLHVLSQPRFVLDPYSSVLFSDEENMELGKHVQLNCKGPNVFRVNVHRQLVEEVQQRSELSTNLANVLRQLRDMRAVFISCSPDWSNPLALTVQAFFGSVPLIVFKTQRLCKEIVHETPQKRQGSPQLMAASAAAASAAAASAAAASNESSSSSDEDDEDDDDEDDDEDNDEDDDDNKDAPSQQTMPPSLPASLSAGDTPVLLSAGPSTASTAVAMLADVIKKTQPKPAALPVAAQFAAVVAATQPAPPAPAAPAAAKPVVFHKGDHKHYKLPSRNASPEPGKTVKRRALGTDEPEVVITRMPYASPDLVLQRITETVANNTALRDMNVKFQACIAETRGRIFATKQALHIMEVLALQTATSRTATRVVLLLICEVMCYMQTRILLDRRQVIWLRELGSPEALKCVKDEDRLDALLQRMEGEMDFSAGKEQVGHATFFKEYLAFFKSVLTSLSV